MGRGGKRKRRGGERKGRAGEGGEGRKGEGRGEEGRERKGRGGARACQCPLHIISGYATKHLHEIPTASPPVGALHTGGVYKFEI